jgi:hypothetical protein
MKSMITSFLFVSDIIIDQNKSNMSLLRIIMKNVMKLKQTTKKRFDLKIADK